MVRSPTGSDINERGFPHLYSPPFLPYQARVYISAKPRFSPGTSRHFPENIAVAQKVHHQNYAVFFFNKFRDIFLTFTLPEIERLFGTIDIFTGEAGWRAGKLEPEAFYQARCIWGYLHDYFHHCGPRPIDRNLQLKLNWFTGLLEEIKVDCQTILACLNNEIPYGVEVAQFALFERLLRYPQQPDCVTNFDSGTGVFLFTWLLNCEVFTRSYNEKISSFAYDKLVRSLQSLIATVEELECRTSDIEYKQAAQKFVRTYLPEGKQPSERFTLPESYHNLIGLHPSQINLEFSELAY